MAFRVKCAFQLKLLLLPILFLSLQAMECIMHGRFYHLAILGRFHRLFLRCAFRPIIRLCLINGLLLRRRSHFLNFRLLRLLLLLFLLLIRCRCLIFVILTFLLFFLLLYFFFFLELYIFIFIIIIIFIFYIFLFFFFLR